MKYAYLLVLVSVFGFPAAAQNWQCMQPGQKVYFTNSKTHYLRGMRIDSVQTQGGNTTYYPYRSPRGPFQAFAHLDTMNGGSWLGKTITSQSDGTTLFSNTRGDTVILKTLAGVGAQWTFYNDTALTYYNATVLSADTARVLGSLDSVKRIGITVMQGGTILSGDSINKYSVVLSKAHGIIQAFDFYNFPYQIIGNGYGTNGGYTDYYVYKNRPTDTSLALFRRVQLILPTYAAIYDYSAGDILQWSTYNGGQLVWGTLTDTFVAAPGTLGYTIHGRETTVTGYGTQNGPVYTTTGYNAYPVYLVNLPAAWIDTTKMPEEWYNPCFYYYDEADTTLCFTSRWYRQAPVFLNRQTATVNTFEPCGGLTDIAMKEGFGITNRYTCLEPVSGASIETKLIYAQKAGSGPCGHYSDLAVKTAPATPVMSIFPNPASASLTIKGIKSTFTIAIFSTDGRRISEVSAEHTPYTFSIRRPSGWYILAAMHNSRLAEDAVDYRGALTSSYFVVALHSMRPLVLFAFCMLHVAFASAQIISPRERQLDSLFSAEYNAGAFYGNVLIAENGRILYQRSFGLSDKTKVVANERSTVFELAGISKQFTAAGILLLKDKGKLGLDDLVSKHIQDFPYPGVTIRQLLIHTSGLPQYTEILAHDWPKGKCCTNAELLTLLKTGKYPAVAKPGQRYEYNNIGYALLALLIERVSGQSYAAFLDDRIFNPLGLTSMTVYSRRCKPRRLPNYAYGYVFSDRLNKYILPDEDSASKNSVRTLDGIVGQGRVHGTIGDVYKWERALASGKLLSAASLKEMFTPGALSSGSPTHDGFGWAINSNKIYGHIYNEGSSWLGYTAFIERHPDHDKTIILLQNISTSLDAVKAARRILYAQSAKRPVRQTIALAAEVLQRYAGEYEISKNYTVTVMMKGGGLEAKPSGQAAFALIPESETGFYSPNVSGLGVHFVKDKGGAVSAMRMVQNGKATIARKTR